MKIQENLNKLEDISSKIQNPDTSIEDAVALYEEGMKIAKETETKLSDLERRIEIVTSGPNEEPVIAEFQ